MSGLNKSMTELTLNQNIDDLRDRMRILQNDRKTNIEVLKANKNSNKYEIQRLRDENKECRQKLALLMKTSLIDGDEDELKHMEKEVSRLRKVNDDLVLHSTRLKRTLDGLMDEVKELELNSVRPHMEDNEFTRTIRNLENKLDKAMIKFNEAQSIRKTYEQIVRRLKDERVGFDNQLSAIERTLGAKQKDYEELLLLAGDANHSREASLIELERVRSSYEVERKRRETEFKERLQVVQLRKQMLDRMNHREKLRQQLAENDELLATQTQSQLTLQNSLTTQKTEAKNKIDVFEAAFRKIKDATGVSDVNEVISKITSQESTTVNLIQLTKDNQDKIESLNVLKNSLKVHVDEIKYAGVGGGHKRKLVDDQEEQLALSTQRVERAKSKYDRLSKVIIAMKAGVGHLQDKLEPVREEISGQKIELTDESVAEVLRECEVNINSVMRKIKAAHNEEKRRNMVMEDDSGESGSKVKAVTATVADGIDIEGAELVDVVSARPFNQRIDITVAMGEGVEPNKFVIESDDMFDGDEEELTREKIKQASAHTLQIEKRKKKTKGGKGDTSWNV